MFSLRKIIVANRCHDLVWGMWRFRHRLFTETTRIETAPEQAGLAEQASLRFPSKRTAVRMSGLQSVWAGYSSYAFAPPVSTMI